MSSLNEWVFDALMAAGKRALADEYAAANGGDDDDTRLGFCEDYPCCRACDRDKAARYRARQKEKESSAHTP